MGFHKDMLNLCTKVKSHLSRKTNIQTLFFVVTKALRTQSSQRKDVQEDFSNRVANEWRCSYLQFALEVINWTRKVQSVLKNSSRGKTTGCVQQRAWDINTHKWLVSVLPGRGGNCDWGWAGSPKPPCTSTFRAAVFLQPLKSSLFGV